MTHIETEQKERVSRIRNPDQLAAFKKQVLLSARQDTPQLAAIPSEEIDSILDTATNLLQKLEQAVRPHPPIHADTDVVVVIAGPGEYSLNIVPFEPKPDRYHYPWARKMDRARVRAGATITREVTAMRLEKDSTDMTEEDIARHGPWLHYAGTEWENEHIRHVLSQDSIPITLEKVFMYDFSDDNNPPVVNTALQIQQLRLPIPAPRRIVIVSHAPHLVRIAFLMEKWKDRIPKGTTVQFFPLPTPSLAVDPYTLMELRGVFAEIYKKGTAAKTPFAFTLE